MDKSQVLKASTSILGALGVSTESQEWVQKQMASLLGIQDPNFYKTVEQLWHEAYEKKVITEKLSREIFATEAIVNGLKYVKGERFEEESAKLQKLKTKHKEVQGEFLALVDQAKTAQEEYLKGRSSSKGI